MFHVTTNTVQYGKIQHPALLKGAPRSVVVKEALANYKRTSALLEPHQIQHKLMIFVPRANQSGIWHGSSVIGKLKAPDWPTESPVSE